MKNKKIFTIILLATISYPVAAADQKTNAAQEEDKRARELEQENAYQAVSEEQQKMDATLVKAIYYGNTTQGIISLLEKRANPNAVHVTYEHNRRIETPAIRLAVVHAHKNPKILRSLIDHKADINCSYEIPLSNRMQQLRMPLHDACTNLPNDNAFQILLDARANCNIIDDRGTPPLYTAIINRRITASLELIKFGARINMIDSLGEMPLSGAWRPVPFSEGFLLPNVTLVKYLLFSKADIPPALKVIKLGIKQFSSNPRNAINDFLASLGRKILDKATYYQLQANDKQIVQLLEHGLTDADIEQCETLSDQTSRAIFQREAPMSPLLKGNIFLQLKKREMGRK